ncbi:aspartate aminotransferase family protein [Clostridium sp. 19966]|uniref:aspartate aminotransferase family protein n=1 Tax=Clostridium sp. 19966 TaxID=2768166 RepID=UPI0028E08AAC|nr:aspartate aminotransferase family protein [Clostridium sp. 19966]MDT8718098.1 aspartate aminotransferase family protein [Clostridium sp. 19966]
MSTNHIMETYKRYEITLSHGKGSKVYDTNGKEYIDFVSGVAVNCLGHAPEIISEALEKQSKKLVHVSNYYWNENHTPLAEKLCDNCDHDKVFFTNSGAEAVEGAIKTAKKYGNLKSAGKKNKIIYMDSSFHGRTLGSLSVTGNYKYQKDFLPLIPNTCNIPFNDVAALKAAFDDEVCGIIMEPVQGEGGINVATSEFLKTARELCDKFDALLIFDEVQCGMGRLGTLFAYKSFNVIPDVLCIAKALGGGFPIGAFITNERASVLTYGDHGSTYGGNPLACAVSLAVLNELVDNGVVASVSEKSQYITNKLKELNSKYNNITEIKGMGLLLGLKTKFGAAKFIDECLEKGLLLISASGDVVRILPPLNVSYQDIDAAIAIMESVLAKNA